MHDPRVLIRLIRGSYIHYHPPPNQAFLTCNTSHGATLTSTGTNLEGGDEGTHPERGHSGCQVVPIDWQGVPIEEVN